MTNDGSTFRHMFVAFFTSLIANAIVPYVGYRLTCRAAVDYEKGKTDPDSLRDIEDGKRGAKYGSLIGIALNFLLLFAVAWSCKKKTSKYGALAGGIIHVAAWYFVIAS